VVLFVFASLLILSLPDGAFAKKKQKESYYQKLGIESSLHATAKDIKKAYFQKVYPSHH
jgi:hypothetical protein